MLLRVLFSVANTFSIIAFLLAMSSCTSGGRHEPMTLAKSDSESSLDRVLKEGTLEVTTNYNSMNYYIYRGQPMGFQYEMLEQFSSSLGVKLKIRIEENLEKAFEQLAEQKTDLVAMGLTVTGERRKRFDFTEPLLITRQVLVQRLPDNWRRFATRDELEAKLLRSSLELGGKTIHVQEGSIFMKRLEVLAEETGDSINIIEDKRGVEELVEAVSKGQIEYTVSDEHMALLFSKIYPDIDVRTPLSFEQRLAWALNKESDNELLNEINEWLAVFTSSPEGRALYRKYFEGSGISSSRRSEFHSMTGGKLSSYDDVVRMVAKDIGWDWRLLASLIYQESEFKPDVVSWAGAFGLMQLMPAAMEQLGIDTSASAEEQIHAGGKYLQYLDVQIPETVTDSNERIKFVLAAYNSGIGHVLDARRLAQKYRKDPNVWTENVDFFLRNKSKPAFYNDEVVYYGYARGEETYRFVVEINERYEHYKNLLPD